jgi:hypothetical protein
MRKRHDKPAALDHVLYEMLMLVLSLRMLSRHGLQQVEGSGWLEVFAIHARNLNEFFNPKNPGGSYMRPDHFVEWTQSYQFDRDLTARASAQIAHLTYSRERPEEKTPWPFEKHFAVLRIPSLQFLTAVAQIESLMAYHDNRTRTKWLLQAFPGVPFDAIYHKANIAPPSA